MWFVNFLIIFISDFEAHCLLGSFIHLGWGEFPGDEKKTLKSYA